MMKTIILAAPERPSHNQQLEKPILEVAPTTLATF